MIEVSSFSPNEHFLQVWGKAIYAGYLDDLCEIIRPGTFYACNPPGGAERLMALLPEGSPAIVQLVHYDDMWCVSFWVSIGEKLQMGNARFHRGKA